MMLQIRELHGSLQFVNGIREFLRVVFVVNGSGTVCVGEGSFGLGNGVVCFVDSLVDVSFSASAESCFVLEFDRGLWGHFLRLYPLARGIDAFGSVHVIHLDLDAASLALSRLSQLMLEVSRGVSYEHQKLLFSLLMLDVFSGRVQVEEPVDLLKLLLVEFNDLLEANFKKERLTSFYARRLAVSSRKLNELCRGWFDGKNVFDVLMDRICSEAEFMLLSSDVPVKAVAYELGFSSTQHFRVYLKRYRGVTPSGVRENTKKLRN